MIGVGSRAGEKQSAHPGDNFTFKFGKEPLVYSIRVKTYTKTSVSRGSSYSTGAPYANSAQSAVTSTLDTRYKIRLSGMGQTKDGSMTVRYEPLDYEADSDSTGAAGHFVTTVRGLSVKSTQNGIEIVDTEKEMGMEQAKPYKNAAVPLLLSGSMEMNGIGEIKDIHGDLPFVDFWHRRLKTDLGLFSLQFPGHAVTNGETLQFVIPLESPGPIKIDGGPLYYTNFLTFAEIAPGNDASLATFQYSAPMFRHDLSGYMEQQGQSTRVDLDEIDVRGSGSLHFDKTRGVLVDEDITKSASLTITGLIQGRAITSHIDMRTQTDVDLLPASGENPDGKIEKISPKDL